MGTPILLLAGVLSFLPALADGELARALEGASRLSLAALPWLALQGIPPNPSPLRARRTWSSELGLALPLLALGAWLDVRAGSDPKELAFTGAGVLILLILLAEARYHAAGLRGYALAWLALVAGAPALSAALSAQFALVRLLARASPLTWAWDRIRIDGESSWVELLLGPIPGVLALLFLAVLWRPRAPRMTP